MDTYNTQFYDLLYRAFEGDATSRRLQGYLDEVMAAKYNGLQLDGFTFAPDMQIDFTYEQAQKELGLTAMAQYYDLDSPAIPRGTEGVTLATGKIPRMKDVEYFNEDKVRKQLLIDKLQTPDRALASAKDKLFVTISDLIGGHTNSLTYQRHQMVSAGKLTINDKNNPKGIQGVTFSANIPASNRTPLATTKRWWTAADYSTEGANADPIQDMIDMVQKASDKGVTSGHFEIQKAYLGRILRHSKVLAAIGADLNPAADAAGQLRSANYAKRSKKIEILQDIIGAPIKEIDSLVAVEKWNKTAKKLEKTNINAFEADVVVFVPDGQLGEVLTVMPIAFQNPAAQYATFYDGRLQLIVEADAVKKCQGFYTEMTSLVVPNVPQYMFYLYPNPTA